MKLKSLEFVEHEGLDAEWKLERFDFNDVNLIVAKNATGKSKTLNVIAYLANLITGRVKVDRGHNYRYEAEFERSDGDDFLKYTLEVSSGKVSYEKLESEGAVFISRDSEGNADVFYDEINTKIKNKFSEDSLSVSNFDDIQKPYLNAMREWANNTVHIKFGSQLGQHVHGAYIDKKPLDDFKNIEGISLFIKEAEVRGTLWDLHDRIVRDLNAIGYSVEEVGIIPVGITSGGDSMNAGEVYSLYVKEKDLNVLTRQELMSQGMFRAVSALVYVNYLEVHDLSCCLLIDDIGEGLDYERSVSLIKLLVDKSKGSKHQVVMTSNDRYVMNGVSLDFWTVLIRNGHRCEVINKGNSRGIFDQFELTGLNNFDFFSRELYKGF